MISKTEKQSLTFFERKEMIFFIIAKDIAFWNVLKVSDSQKKILVSSKKQLNQKKKNNKLAHPHLNSTVVVTDQMIGAVQQTKLDLSGSVWEKQ